MLRDERKTNFKMGIFQAANGIISLILGFMTFNSRRPHKYVDAGYCDPGYPYRCNTLDLISREPKSLLSMFSPVLVAGLVSIANSIFLLKSRLNREMKLWVKFVIIFVNFAWLFIVVLIPAHILPAIEHPVYLTENTFYGVYKNQNYTKRVSKSLI